MTRYSDWLDAVAAKYGETHQRMTYGERKDEGRPYLQCPHCGKFQFRLIIKPRFTSTSWIPFKGELVNKSTGKMECEYCEYIDREIEP